MNKSFVPFLPPWVETGLQPAFYDAESGTVLQQTARMYAKVNQLTRHFNELSENVTKEINSFEQNINDIVDDYIDKFNQLHDYVYYYFDNLDVQEEINNKLDDMLEDGTLEEIIGQYIEQYVNLQYRKYNTVAEMLADTTLTAGVLVQTFNFREGDNQINDYVIVETEDSPSLELLTIDGNLKAQLLYPENIISPDMLGAYGDGTHDDISYITFAIAKSKSAGLNLVFNTNKVYGISDTITIDSETYLDFNNATLKVLSAVSTVFDVDYTDFNGAIKNLRLDCNGLADKAMNFTGNRKFEVTSINIWNIKSIGIQIDSGYEYRFNEITMNTDGTVYTNTAGFIVNTADIEFHNIFMREMKRGFVLNSSVSSRFSNIHAWTINNSNFIGSKMFDMNTTGDADLSISDVYCDTYQYFIYYSNDKSPRVSVVNANYRLNTSATGTTNSYIFHAQNTGQYDRLMITGSTFIGQGSTGTPTTSTSDDSLAFIPRTTAVQFINMIVPTLSLIDLSGSVTAVNNIVEVDAQYVSISAVFTVTTTGSNITLSPIGKLPTAYIMPKSGRIADGAMVADSRWDWVSASSVYAYLDTATNGLQIRVPGRTAGSTDYIFLDIKYPRKPIV